MLRNNLVTLKIGTVCSSETCKHLVTTLCTKKDTTIIWKTPTVKIRKLTRSLEKEISEFSLPLSSIFSIHTSQLSNSRRCIVFTNTCMLQLGWKSATYLEPLEKESLRSFRCCCHHMAVLETEMYRMSLSMKLVNLSVSNRNSVLLCWLKWCPIQTL
jgi:hypothetical protein